MGFNRAVRIQDVSDGTSKTVLLAEIRTGLFPYDNRGVWALGVAASSSLWGHGGIDGDNYGPNCAEPVSVGPPDAVGRRDAGALTRGPAQGDGAAGRGTWVGCRRYAIRSASAA